MPTGPGSQIGMTLNLLLPLQGHRCSWLLVGPRFIPVAKHFESGQVSSILPRAALAIVCLSRPLGKQGKEVGD